MGVQELIERRDSYLAKIEKLKAINSEDIEARVAEFRAKLEREACDSEEIKKYERFVESLNEMISTMEPETPVVEEKIVEEPVKEEISTVEESITEESVVEEIKEPEVEYVEETPVVEEPVKTEPKSVLEKFNEKAEEVPFFVKPQVNPTSTTGRPGMMDIFNPRR